MKGTSSYDGSVPRWLFPVVWSILYILMGISSYIISDNKIHFVTMYFNFLFSLKK